MTEAEIAWAAGLFEGEGYLVDALNDNWKKYAQKAMPKEVRDDGSTDA